MLSTDGSTPTKFDDDSLRDVMVKLAPLSSPNIRNHITSMRSAHGSTSVESNILELKRLSRYNYIHGSSFPGQDRTKSWLFKMSTTGGGSSVDLVKRMQRGEDLQNSWIMFDHVNRVKHWTTMACHVYEPSFCKVMTIATCDMKTEDVDSQVIMWQSIIEQMEKVGTTGITSAGWMADSAMANFNAVRRVFGTDPNVPIEGRERACAFHWAQSLEKHTRDYIVSSKRGAHIKLCHA